MPGTFIGLRGIGGMLFSRGLVNPGTGAFGASPGAKVSGRTAIDDGNGWWIVHAIVDITDGDVTGNFALALTSGDGATTITRDASHTVLFHDVSVSHV